MSFILSPYRFAVTGFAAFSSQQRYNANPQGANDQAGYSVAVSGDGLTMAIGAPFDDDEFSNGGRVFVFTRGVGNAWTQQAVVKPTSGGGAGQFFGISVSLSGDGNTLLVGAPSDGTGTQGKAFVFTRSGGVWTQHTDLFSIASPAPDVSARFGQGVAINLAGDTIAVGAPWQGAFDRGAVWCFALSGGVWSQQVGNLAATGAANTDYMGGGLALSDDGNTLLASTRAKKAEVFKRTGGTTWAYSTTLAPASPPAGTNPSDVTISAALSSDGKRAFVPCPTGNVSATNDGCVYEFTESGGVWTETAGFRFTPTAPSNGIWYGYRFCMNAAGDRAVICGTAGFGLAEVWSRSGSVWTRDQIIDPGIVAGDNGDFGPCSISDDGLVLAIGAPTDDDPGAANDGAVYTFM